MKAIQTGNTFEIYDDSLRVFDTLPPNTYTVCFHKLKGFYLEKRYEISAGSEKIYGVHNEKSEKVLESFSLFKRNLGVILSGDKGIGKSLFTRLLAQKAVERGMPVLIVNEYIPGIASYLDSIRQEIMVLFDEYDKTFGGIIQENGSANPQTELLGLFDGIASGKKLFVITCNDLNKISDYLVNRPGRFHYHFRFEYPTSVEIREYLMDNIPKEMYGQIDDVIRFGRMFDLNYDCLRSISFEISCGRSFSEAIKDLNIINVTGVKYEAVLYFNNGYRMNRKKVQINLAEESTRIDLLTDKGNNFLDISFNPKNIIYNMEDSSQKVMPENISISYRYEPDEGDTDDMDCTDFKSGLDSGMHHLELIRGHGGADLHYTV